MAEFTIEQAIAIQRKHLNTLATYVQPLVIKRLTSICEAHNKKVKNPYNVLRGVTLDNMLANYGLFKTGQGGYDLSEAYELQQY